MTGVVLLNPRTKFTDASGTPIAGGSVTVYRAGTTTLAATYQDKALTVANTNPITLDANGECLLWADSGYTYKILLQDAQGATVAGYPVDNITGGADVGAAAAAAAAAAAPYLAAAEAAQSGAEDAQAAAETARDSALAAARIYANTTAGLAAVASGEYFYTVSAEDSETLILWRDNAGVAEDTGKRMPSSAAINVLHSTPVADVEYAVQDSNDNASEFIEPTTGTHHFLAVDAAEVNGIPRERLAKACRSAPNLTATYVAHISYGQSLSLGNGSDIHTLAAVGDGFFDCLMFNANGTTSAGPRAQEGSGTTAQNHASFIAYEERPISGSSPSGNFETPLGNALRMIKRLLRDEDGVAPTDYDYFLVGSAPGQGNTAISGLAKGQTPYNRLIDDVTYGLANANAAGGSYAVDVVYWSQGERDIALNTARATYKAALLQLYTDLNADIKALTGQAHDIKLVMYQVSEYDQSTVGWAGPNIALAQLDAAKENSNIVLATCVYAVEHLSATNVHLTGLGYAHLGAYYGLAAKRTVVDGESWANLYPTRLTRQGTILDVEFPDTGYPLAISDTLFASQTNAGFTAVETDGTTDNPITNVEVVAPRRVRITLTNAAAGYLRYGFANWGGNLHDTCDIDPGTAREVPLYRPCLTFEESFA